MAKLYNTIFARGLAGIVDEFEVETRSGKFIHTHKDLFDDARDYIEALPRNQSSVLEATTYANFARMQDVYINRELETGIPAYNLAVADWFVAPRVLEINVDRWTGKIGQVIRVKARDNVMVAKVLVVIRNEQGKVLEAGEAQQAVPGSAWWHYTTRTTVPMAHFPSVKAFAKDLPGNTASFTVS
jgi:hypothetical protein